MEAIRLLRVETVATDAVPEAKAIYKDDVKILDLQIQRSGYCSEKAYAHFGEITFMFDDLREIKSMEVRYPIATWEERPIHFPEQPQKCRMLFVGDLNERISDDRPGIFTNGKRDCLLIVFNEEPVSEDILVARNVVATVSLKNEFLSLLITNIIKR